MDDSVFEDDGSDFEPEPVCWIATSLNPAVHILTVA